MKRYIIGIDEVGRGSLAGPVVVAAVLLQRNFQTKIRVNPLLKNKNPRQSASIIKLRDSKKLSPRQREIWFKYIKKHPEIFHAIASVSPRVIDRINVSQAANLAATRAFIRLLATNELATRNLKIFLDGGLYLDKKKIRVNPLLKKFIPRLSASTVIRGDEKIPAISLASVVAKVTRDRYMKKVHKKYPRYDFINNVGYGTAKHIKALKKFGKSPIHRESFKFH